MISFQKPNVEKLNGPFAQYTIAYRESGKAEMLANVTSINTTCHTISNLKKWTLYFIKVRVENLAHAGPWSVDRDAKTQQDGLSKLLLIVSSIFTVSGAMSVTSSGFNAFLSWCLV